jgi:hypothetical protein
MWGLQEKGSTFQDYTESKEGTKSSKTVDHEDKMLEYIATKMAERKIKAGFLIGCRSKVWEIY